MRKFLRFFLILIFLVFGIYLIAEIFNSEPPSPTITFGKKGISTAQGSYCWNGLLNLKCVDMTSPPMIIKHEGLKPVVVSPEAQLKVEFKNEPKKNTLRANKWISNEEKETAKLNDNVLTAPKEKGVYVYDIFARWDKGDSSYVFVIEVQ